MKTLRPLDKFILASQSPRRIEILRDLGLNFEVVPADIEEKSTEDEPKLLVQDLALQKARYVHQFRRDLPILAADTLVFLNDEVLGKPKTIEENRLFLQKLSGKWHTVLTGLAFLDDKEHLAFDETRVLFKELSDDEISWYINSKDGLDKAGGYGAQNKGMMLIEKIDGNYHNIIGLSVIKLIDLFRQAGFNWFK